MPDLRKSICKIKSSLMPHRVVIDTEKTVWSIQSGMYYENGFNAWLYNLTKNISKYVFREYFTIINVYTKNLFIWIVFTQKSGLSTTIFSKF